MYRIFEFVYVINDINSLQKRMEECFSAFIFYVLF